MSDLYDRIQGLCDIKGINMTEMCKLSGANRGSLTDLKNGRKKSLAATTLSKIAAFFDVPVDYLLDNPELRSSSFSNISDSTVIQGNSGSVKVGNIASGSPQPLQDSLTEQEAELLRIFRGLSLRDKTSLMATAFELEDKAKG